MASNRLHITDNGLQAANNASAGGIFINLTNWQIGKGTVPTQDTDSALSGAVIAQGEISFIEVMDEHSCRFVIDVPDYAVDVPTTATEVGVFIESGNMFARCVFEAPIELLPGEGWRLNCMLNTNRCDLTVINVVVGNYSSVPVTPYVWSLPSPVASEHNMVGVLNGLHNPDGSTTPIMAMRYGAGNFEWSFTGFQRVYRGTVTVTPDGFDAPLVGFNNNEVLIAHCAAGTGLARTRALKFSTASDSFIELDGKPFGISGTSIISIWKRLDGNNVLVGSCTYPPQMTDIPEDYVLTRGLGGCPVWSPPKQTSKIISTLYTSPGKLKINRQTFTGNDRESRYVIDGVFKDVNHVYTAVGSITQHRSAFDVSGSELEFSENIPSGALVDLRAFVKQAGTGTYLDVVTQQEVGDGLRTRFPLSYTPATIDDTFVFVSGGLQSYSAYTYDAVGNAIVLNEAVDGGLSVEINTLKHTQREGYSTRIVTHTFVTYGDTLFFELPIFPQTKEQVWISMSGTHIHSNLYNLIDNKIVLQAAIPGSIEVECFIFENVKAEGTANTNLVGMVVDATLTGKNLRLHRHCVPDVVLRIPTVNMSSGPGIRISGQHPNYKIESLISEQLTADTVFKQNFLEKKENSEEIISVRRVKVESDLLLQVTCDFSVQLGPGFLSSEEGDELIEYVVGFRTTSAIEPEYGRQIRGTGKAGFSVAKEGTSNFAYANSSLTQSYTLNKDNLPAGYIDIVCKMRVRNAVISRYESLMFLNVNIVGFPKI